MIIGLTGDGKMGKAIERLAKLQGMECSFPVTPLIETDTLEFQGKIDILIDFSNPNNLPKIANFVKGNPLPLVIGTTGYSEDDKALLQELAGHMALLFSSNFSVGVNVMNALVGQLAKLVGRDFDFEVIEKHHNQKLDAPSGTAKTLLEVINEVLNYKVVPGRDGLCPRSHDEIGVHAIRGGTIVGEHEVIAAGTDEIITIKHEALSRDIFANGAIKAALWLESKEKGYYTMNDVLFGKEK